MPGASESICWAKGKVRTLSSTAPKWPVVLAAAAKCFTSFRGISRACFISSGKKVREKRSPSGSPARRP